MSIVSFLVTMSLSKSPNAPLSADEARTLTSLLMRMQAAGLEPAADAQGYGAMTDASKRRKPESEVSLEEEFEHIEPFVQYEVEKPGTEKPKSSTDGSVGKTRVHIPLVNVGGVKIPPNEKDMEDWSTTLCELPKVVHLGMSYAELIADPEFMDYLIWVRTHGVKKKVAALKISPCFCKRWTIPRSACARTRTKRSRVPIRFGRRRCQSTRSRTQLFEP